MRLECVFDVKAEESDPDKETLHESDRKTLAQIGKNAWNLMFSNMSLFVFVVGIYGHSVRIYRFDHAGAIVSCSFNYVTDPQLLGQFYWRLVHPIVDSTPSIHNRFIVGSDTTVKRRCIFDLLIPQAVGYPK